MICYPRRLLYPTSHGIDVFDLPGKAETDQTRRTRLVGLADGNGDGISPMPMEAYEYSGATSFRTFQFSRGFYWGELRMLRLAVPEGFSCRQRMERVLGWQREGLL